MSLPNIRRNEQRHDHNSPNRALSSNHHQLECRPRQFVGNFIRPSLCNTNSQIPQKVSVAIDFGTSNCAVAYSAHSKKEDVFVINEWNDGEKHGKIPTAVLFNDKKEFVAFGKVALDMYRDLKVDEEDQKFYFLQNFKMKLYNEKV